MGASILLGLLFATAVLLVARARLLLAALFRPRPAPGAEAAPRACRCSAAGRRRSGRWSRCAPGAGRRPRALLKAGFYHPSALADYRAVRSLLTLFPVFFGLELALLWQDNGYTLLTVGYGLLGGLIGLAIPALYVRRCGEERGRRIKCALPLALDLLSLCLTAGVNLLDAFAHVGRQSAAHAPRAGGRDAAACAARPSCAVRPRHDLAWPTACKPRRCPPWRTR